MGDAVRDAGAELAAVPRLPDLWVLHLAVRVVKDGIQCSVPAGRGGHLEQQDERLEEGLEVVDVVEPWSDLDVLEEADAEDGKDEHDEEEEEANVEQGRKRHPQGKEQCPNSLCAFDQTQNSTNLKERYLYFKIRLK